MDLELVEFAPLPWRQGKIAHTGKSVYAADGRPLFTVHRHYEPESVALAALIVEAVNGCPIPAFASGLKAHLKAGDWGAWCYLDDYDSAKVDWPALDAAIDAFAAEFGKGK